MSLRAVGKAIEAHLRADSARACAGHDTSRRMLPWVLIEREETADATRLELLQRGSEFSIRANGELLMSSRQHGSEQALAELGLAALPSRERARVLVGGLGCGYTLAAALARLGPEASVTVAELSPAVVRWNRGVLGKLAGWPLEAPQVRVLETDVAALFRAGTHTFDAILLDVDNGPQAVARASNGWLYSPQGLSAIRAVLAPAGVLALWSAGPERGFTERVRGAGFTVAEHRPRAREGQSRQRHCVWVACRT